MSKDIRKVETNEDELMSLLKSNNLSKEEGNKLIGLVSDKIMDVAGVDSAEVRKSLENNAMVLTRDKNNKFVTIRKDKPAKDKPINNTIRQGVSGLRTIVNRNLMTSSVKKEVGSICNDIDKANKECDMILVEKHTDKLKAIVANGSMLTETELWFNTMLNNISIGIKNGR